MNRDKGKVVAEDHPKKVRNFKCPKDQPQLSSQNLIYDVEKRAFQLVSPEKKRDLIQRKLS